jgi:uncharacterized protein YbgA (DUF1722 family)/uncharacterized protein YbbK (DUF523 family)
LTKEKPIIGISGCLLGENVRHDGGHKRQDWIKRELSKWVNWESVCPELAMGLGVPREPIHQKRTSKTAKIKLLSVKSGLDHTELARETSEKIIKKLPKSLNGFIFKKSSPSCGMDRVKIYDWNNSASFNGVGTFAAPLMDAYPDIPCTEEGRLFDPLLREHFVTRVFAHHAVSNLHAKVSEIQKFHESYKFLLQAHNESSMRKLGRIAANSERLRPSEVLTEYKSVFLSALEKKPSVKKRTNVMEHIWGFVKHAASQREKNNILKNIELYRRGELPFVAIITLMGHVIERHGATYIEKQKFLNPYPEKLSVKNWT